MPAHERAQQHAQRHGRRADHQLQQLEPDDLVDQGGAAAADKQQQQRRKEPARGHQAHLSWKAMADGITAIRPAVLPHGETTGRSVCLRVNPRP